MFYSFSYFGGHMRSGECLQFCCFAIRYLVFRYFGTTHCRGHSELCLCTVWAWSWVWAYNAVLCSFGSWRVIEQSSPSFILLLPLLYTRGIEYPSHHRRWLLLIPILPPGNIWFAHLHHSNFHFPEGVCSCPERNLYRWNMRLPWRHCC